VSKLHHGSQSYRQSSLAMSLFRRPLIDLIPCHGYPDYLRVLCLFCLLLLYILHTFPLLSASTSACGLLRPFPNTSDLSMIFTNPIWHFAVSGPGFELILFPEYRLLSPRFLCAASLGPPSFCHLISSSSSLPLVEERARLRLSTTGETTESRALIGMNIRI